MSLLFNLVHAVEVVVLWLFCISILKFCVDFLLSSAMTTLQEIFTDTSHHFLFHEMRKKSREIMRCCHFPGFNTSLVPDGWICEQRALRRPRGETTTSTPVAWLALISNDFVFCTDSTRGNPKGPAWSRDSIVSPFYLFLDCSGLMWQVSVFT